MATGKTLLITEIFPPTVGGSGRWFWEIYRRMPREQVVIAAARHPKQEEFDATHDLQIVRTSLDWRKTHGIIDLAGARDHARAFLAVRRIVRQHAITRVHCARLVPEGWIAWILKKLYGLPFMCYVHGEELNKGQGRQIGWMMRPVLRHTEFLVANSRNTSRVLRDVWNVHPDRIRLLHPGVDTERFVPAPASREIRAQLGWHDRPVVLTVSRLQKRKGHDQMIRSLSTIRRAIPDILYSIVGDGAERDSLQQLVQEHGLQQHVQFRGETDDAELAQCYQQCDLFVLPNREVNGDFEGFGMVLLEAQACGKPVVAGTSGGTAETMDIGRTGRVVSCDGPNELAALVVELLGEAVLRKQMGKAARQWAVDRFAWESLSRQASELFNHDFPSVAGTNG